MSTLTPADDELPDLWRGRLNAWSAMALFYLGRHAEAGLRAKESLHDAQRSGDALSIAEGHMVVARLTSPESSMKFIDAALAAGGDDPESVELHTQLLRYRLWYARRLGRPDELDATQSRAQAAAGRVGSYQSAHLVLDMAENAYFEGRWDDGLQMASGTSELAPVQLRAAAHTVAALVAMHREQHQTVEAQLAAAGYLDPPGVEPTSHPTSDDGRQPPQYFALRDEAFALRAEIGGDLHRALAWRKKWLDQPQPVRDEYCFLAPDLMRNALAVNDVATARASLEACEAAEVPFPDGLLTGRCCRGLLDGDGTQLLLLAQECRRRFRWNLLAAMLEEVAAARIADTGDTIECPGRLQRGGRILRRPRCHLEHQAGQRPPAPVRNPPRPAQRPPARHQRLGGPHPRRSARRTAGRPGIVQSGHRPGTSPVPQHRPDPRVFAPGQAGTAIADRSRPAHPAGERP